MSVCRELKQFLIHADLFMSCHKKCEVAIREMRVSILRKAEKVQVERIERRKDAGHWSGSLYHYSPLVDCECLLAFASHSAPTAEAAPWVTFGIARVRESGSYKGQCGHII